MDTNQLDPDTYQFPPVSVHLAKSDAAWLRLWAPDPRSLGAEAMGLAALRGLLAEDQPKDGQPLGGEIQHARALIENARHALHVDTPIKSHTDTVPDFGDTQTDFLRRRIAHLEERVEDMGNRMAYRMTEVENDLAAAKASGAKFRKRVLALLAAIYRPQRGDEVDIIDRETNEIITTVTVHSLAEDGPRTTETVYALPHVED